MEEIPDHKFKLKNGDILQVFKRAGYWQITRVKENKLRYTTYGRGAKQAIGNVRRAIAEEANPEVRQVRQRVGGEDVFGTLRKAIELGTRYMMSADRFKKVIETHGLMGREFKQVILDEFPEDPKDK